MAEKIHSMFKTPGGTEIPVMDIQGKPYLKVPHRVLWFREVHPNGRIKTEAVTIHPESALFRAVICSEDGAELASAHKYEDKRGFPDFIEKAETGAIGRALGLCGFGTQFTGDEFEEGKRLADAPVTRVVSRPADSSAGGYIIPFGKLKGQQLTDVPVADLENYKDWLMKNAAKDGKPLSGNAQDFISNVDAYINERTSALSNELHGDLPF